MAFIDIKAAYDHVDREALWYRLQHVIGMPSQLLAAIQNMFSGDAYHFLDGLTSTAPICPSKGVKQGCPLSPILFALFLSDAGAAFGVRHSTGRMGVPLQHLERGQSGSGMLRICCWLTTWRSLKLVRSVFNLKCTVS
jgi:hypothetical protein